jgi:hypothetical protein
MRRAPFIALLGVMLLSALLSTGLANPGGALRLTLSLTAISGAEAQARTRALLRELRPGEPGTRPLLPMRHQQQQAPGAPSTPAPPVAPTPAPEPSPPQAATPPSRPAPNKPRPTPAPPAHPAPQPEPAHTPGGLPAPPAPSPTEQLLEDAERVIKRAEPTPPDAARGLAPDQGRLHAPPPTQPGIRRPSVEEGSHLMPEKVGGPKLNKPPK